MCGIFGLVQTADLIKTEKVFRDLFLLSESRGKEASGFAIKDSQSLRIFKTPFPASVLIKSKVLKNEIDHINFNTDTPFIGIGHSRLVTNGYEQFTENNQPIVKNGMVVIHNGIIVNESPLWKEYGSENKTSELDSELIPTILSDELGRGAEIGSAMGSLFEKIVGMTNIAMLSEKYDNLILATNNGSIYYYNNLTEGVFVFASEKFILEKLLYDQNINHPEDSIIQLSAGDFISINLKTFSCVREKIGHDVINIGENTSKSKIVFLKGLELNKKIYINSSLNHKSSEVDNRFKDEFVKRQHAISHLKRCTKCILPETFPFIEFDERGVCNYCNGYQKINYLGKDALVKITDGYRRNDNKPECLVPFSGGRDSSYALHFIATELHLKPIAFSYDWGMLTDLARRNQSRMCGKLGIEHILVSADIRKKRENIRKNVSAWLKRPALGTIPLFMAGDKQYFYYSKLLQKQNDIRLVLMGENHLEKTLFKSAFSGAKQESKGYMAYHISTSNKMRMLSYYFFQYLSNPALFNSSLIDTFGAFLSYYTIKHDYTNFYNYVKWDEKSINEVLRNEYDWETDPETNSTWRIGDGTAAFYNYIYYMVAGFTENDTFRSNQIREGSLSRIEALKLANEENSPRFDSVKWYCDTIHIDFENSLERINRINTLFKV